MQRKTSGRGRLTTEEREERIQEYERSGLTQREYAAQIGIGLSTLSYWLRRRRREASGMVRPDWVEVRPGGFDSGAFSGGAAAYRVRFPSGLVLEIAPGFAAEELNRLCRALREL